MGKIPLSNNEKTLYQAEAIRLAEIAIKEQKEIIERYEKVLCALLNISANTDQDILIDIIVDALAGHGLMEQYEQDALEGSNLLAQYLD